MSLSTQDSVASLDTNYILGCSYIASLLHAFSSELPVTSSSTKHLHAKCLVWQSFFMPDMHTNYEHKIFTKSIYRHRSLDLHEDKHKKIWLSFPLWKMHSSSSIKEAECWFLALSHPAYPVNCWKVPTVSSNSANIMARGINSIKQKYHFRELNLLLTPNK